MQAVQLVIAYAVFAAALREALTRSGPWQVVFRQAPDICQKCVLVLDEDAFERLPLPLPNPERVVLITPRKDAQHLSLAWDAGIVSVVVQSDPTSTVLLAIMAAALRVKSQAAAAAPSGISPNHPSSPAPISSATAAFSTKRSKNQ